MAIRFFLAALTHHPTAAGLVVDDPHNVGHARPRATLRLPWRKLASNLPGAIARAINRLDGPHPASRLRGDSIRNFPALHITEWK